MTMAFRTDHRAIVRGVQRNELLDRHFSQFCCQLDVDIAGVGDRREVGAHRDAEHVEVGEDVGIAENVFQGLQLGDVVARFLRHLEAQVIGRQTLRLVFLDRPTDRAFAPVVGGQRQVPVAVQFVNVLQVVERRAGRLDDVAPFVDPPVLFQIVLLAGRRHELPQAGSMAARVGGRIVGALDHRQQGNFHRHAALVEFDNDEMQVTAAACDHPPQIVRAVHVPLLMVKNQRVVDVRHREAATQVLEDLRGLVGQVDGLGQRCRRGDFNHRQGPVGSCRHCRCGGLAASSGWAAGAFRLRVYTRRFVRPGGSAGKCSKHGKNYSWRHPVVLSSFSGGASCPDEIGFAARFT
jgi:hypothetical protein